MIVTGAGGGIGRATALAFGREGAAVVVADLKGDGARETVEAIEAGGSGRAVAVVGDLSRQDVVDQVVAAAVKEFGGVDVLVNNAGVMDSMALAASVEDAEWERVIRINLTAPFMLARAALPYMVERGKGSIVNVASEAGLRGSAAGAAYTASKHGVVGLTRSIAVGYRDRGIRANAVAPGGVATSIMSDVAWNEEGLRILAPNHASAGRVAEPEEIAAAITFLASDAASNINGVILPVDNGWSAI